MPALAPTRHPRADRDDLRAATGQGAHDRGAATDVRPVADDDSRGDPALHHRGAQRAGVVVDEAFMHDGRPAGEVRTEADPGGVGDAHTAGNHVVGHPRELVHAPHGHRSPAAEQAQPRRLEPVHRARPLAGPHHVGQHAEHPVEVEPVRRDQPVGQQVQAQVGIGRVRRCGVESDDGAHDRTPDTPPLVPAFQRAQRGERGAVAGRRGVGRTDDGRGIPGIEHLPRIGRGDQPVRPGRLSRSPRGGGRSGIGGRHGWLPYRRDPDTSRRPTGRSARRPPRPHDGARRAHRGPVRHPLSQRLRAGDRGRGRGGAGRPRAPDGRP